MFRKKKRDNNLIKLSGEIVMNENLVRIEPTSGDPWVDFGYWLEATSFMAKQAMVSRGWTKEEIKKYTQDYLNETLKTYELK